MRALRWLLSCAAVLLLAACSAVLFMLWWSVPQAGMTATVTGLSAPVAISLDQDGIPRIKAGSAADAAAALGFMHARDRMFEMELMRRSASGRLSELAGAATLRLDRANRMLGLRPRAVADLEGLDPATRATLEAYARGVNAWIGLRGRFAAPEFIPLGTPEPWTPVDSLLWGKTMGVWLSGNWRQELARSALAARLPAGTMRLLYPAWDHTPPPQAALAAAATRLASLVPRFPEPFTLPSTASNEWAVDGRHTTSGAPLLAGDPHLALAFPSIWYLARIETPGGVLAGATAPGVPFLVMGHNGRIAWTFTTTGADTQDVFVETPLEPGTYATPEGPRPFTIREERIRVLGQPDHILHVRETRHGPVMSDLDPTPDGPVLAVAMANLLPGDSAAAGLAALNAAQDVDEAGRAATLIAAPVQNLLVADRQRIAQFTTGRIPIRKQGDGSLPAPGADGAHDWAGFAQGEALPHVVAPDSGRLVNANERTAGPDFPVFMGADWFGDWRAQRIRQMLDARPKHDAASFAAMQVDVVSAFAQKLLPSLIAVQPPDDASRRLLDALRRWDGAMRAEQPQPLLFNTWMRRLQAELLRRAGVDGPAGPLADFVFQALSNPAEPWCPDGCGAVLAETLAAAARELQDRNGAGWDTAPWGTVHQAVFAHPILGQLPLLQRFTTWRIDQPGDDTTVFRGSSRQPGWGSVHGPGYRGVYDLADLDGSLFSVTPGQSGHPLLGTATSMMHRWRDGTPVQLGPQPRNPAGTIGLHP